MAESEGTFRALLRANLPWFMQRGRAWQVIEPIGRAFDRLTQELIEASNLGFPSLAPPDALPLIGRDRRIPQAPGEDEASYRRRLLLWLDFWAHAGTPLGLLYALQSYIFPGYPRVRMVSRAGWWYTLEEGASRDMVPYEAATLPCSGPAGEQFVVGMNGKTTPYRARYIPPIGAAQNPRAAFWLHRSPVNNWDYDSISNPERASGPGKAWWDYWLIVYRPAWPFQGTYDSGAVVYGSRRAWGMDEFINTFITFVELVATYQRAGANCRAVILAPTLADFDPTSAPGAPGMPDGWWGKPVKPGPTPGTVINSRRADCRFIEQFPQ